METPLATVQIESEVYETKPAMVGGPPRWLKKVEPSQQNSEAKRETDQLHHRNILFQLGQRHQSQTNLGEEKSAGSESFDEFRSNDKMFGGTVGVHRSTSTRHLDVSTSDLSKQPEPEGIRKNAAETYLGISLRDLSNKLFMTQNYVNDRGGVEETKEGEDDSKRSGPSIVGFDIAKVIPKNLLESITAIPTMPFYGSKSSDEAPLNDPANGKAPLFTEEMREKQQQCLAPFDEIRIIDPCEACRVDLAAVEDSGCYLRPAQSDDMSCITLPNMDISSQNRCEPRES